MKTIKRIFTVLLLTAVIKGQGQTTRSFPVEPFETIHGNGIARIYYSVSDTLSATVSADKDEISQVDVHAAAGTLYVSTSGQFRHDVNVRVKGPRLRSVI